MRATFFCASVAMLMSCISGNLEAQAKKPAVKARFTDDAIEFFKATTQGYELNGKTTPPAMDIAAILRATQSKEPQVQDVARMACRMVYLHALLRQQKTESTERATFMNRTIGLEFTPAADGAYRIVCSEAYSGPQPLTLSVQRK